MPVIFFDKKVRGVPPSDPCDRSPCVDKKPFGDKLVNAQSILRKAEGPAFVTDCGAKLLDWNEAANELLGFPIGDARGQPVHRLVELRDVHGNSLDLARTSFFDMVTSGEPVQSFEIQAKAKAGDFTRMTVSVVVVLGRRKTETRIVYFLRPIMRRRKVDEAIERLLSSPSGLTVLDRVAPADDESTPALTPRQQAVLRLLAQGHSNVEIANRLCLSVFTVRSHVQSILDRLRVHSKVEAVSRAFRDRLV